MPLLPSEDMGTAQQVPNIERESMSKETTIPSFNPSGSEVVAEVKKRTEELMDYIRSAVPENRCRSIALTNYEQAAMWAVKANFTV